MNFQTHATNDPEELNGKQGKATEVASNLINKESEANALGSVVGKSNMQNEVELALGTCNHARCTTMHTCMKSVPVSISREGGFCIWYGGV